MVNSEDTTDVNLENDNSGDAFSGHEQRLKYEGVYFTLCPIISHRLRKQHTLDFLSELPMENLMNY